MTIVHVPRVIESEDELPTPDVDDLNPGAPPDEINEPADINDAGSLDDGDD
jgi:hypothetical protein